MNTDDFSRTHVLLFSMLDFVFVCVVRWSSMQGANGSIRSDEYPSLTIDASDHHHATNVDCRDIETNRIIKTTELELGYREYAYENSTFYLKFSAICTVVAPARTEPTESAAFRARARAGPRARYAL
jgi:hypothetical protein